MTSKGMENKTNKTRYCYYHVTEKEREYIQKLQIEYGFKNLSSYIRASLFDVKHRIKKHGFESENGKVKRKEYKFRVTESEYQQIKKEKDKYFKTMSEYIRLRSLKNEVRVTQAIKNSKVDFLKKMIGLMTLHKIRLDIHHDLTDELITLINKDVDRKLYQFKRYSEFKRLSIELKKQIDLRGGTKKILLLMIESIERFK